MLPGGQTDKLGNRYESWWTVSQLVRMIFGQATAIRIEDPTVEKAEFVLTTPQGIELHQTKRHHHQGKWTLSDLGNSQNKVLQAVHKQLVGNTTTFHFVSGSDAPELRELADRSRDASFEEFKTISLSAKVQRQAFARLLRVWNEPDEIRAYDVLRRVFVKTGDEATFVQLAHSQLRSLYLAPSSDVADFLRSIVADRICVTIPRDQLIEELEKKGFNLRRISSSESALPAIDAITTNYLDGISRRLIGKTLVPRKGATELFARVTSQLAGTDTVLTGSAGTGKSGCVMQFVDLLRKENVPVLAIRLDRLDPVGSAYEIGTQLKLEESPALVLAAAAENRPCVLIIDQLDAVSTASGRNADFLDAVESLVDEARGLRARTPIHVVLVCRQFDWDNDHRLRKLMSEKDPKIELGAFYPKEVAGVLQRINFDSKRLSAKQLELLQLPQNLSLFVDCPEAWDKLAGFGSTKDLFDAYWLSKREAVNKRARPEPDSWMQITDLLAERMTETQQLSVPLEWLDPVSPGYLAQMVSEGVLAFDGNRYGFGHESFFDYCFARRFVRAGRSLGDLLQASEQHLFRRAQVRQVLAYLRDSAPERYCSELDSLLRSELVRSHIKDLALSLLASVSEVKEEEWSLLEPWIQQHLSEIRDKGRNSDKLCVLVWRHVFASQSWFEAFNKRDLIAEWLKEENDFLNNIATHYLRFHQRKNGDEAALLLTPYADAGGQWPLRLRSCMEWGDHENSRAYFELFLRLIDNGVLDDARGPIAVNSTFWSMLYGLGTKKLEWIPEVLSHWLRRRLLLVMKHKDAEGSFPWNELFGHDQAGSNHIHSAAKHHPAVFVREVLPVLLEISEAASLNTDHLPRRDAVWDNFFPTDYLSFEQSCHKSLRNALGSLAQINANEVNAVCADLKDRKTYFGNSLLLTIYTDGAAHFAKEAVEVVCREPWRFDCGYSDSRYWIASQMIAAVAPHCTTEDLALLETAILNYVPEWEKSESGHRWVGSAAHALLLSVPPKYRSSEAARRYAELVRKFGNESREPRGMIGGFVGSPIEDEAAEKMTDEQWLRAIAKYDTDDRRDRWKDFLKGGASQLARKLEEHVKRDPDRFGRLALRLPPSTNPIYLINTLDGLRASSASAALQLEVCRKAFKENPIRCGQAVVDSLGAIEEPLSDDFVQMIHWVATKHPDPDEEVWRTDAGGGVPYYGGDILMAGINCARGRAARAVESLIWQDAGYIQRFDGTISALVQDPIMSVRVCVVRVLLAVASHNEGLAIKWFFELTDGKPVVLATAYGDEFLFRGIKKHFLVLRPMVEALLRSDLEKGRGIGARLSCLAVLWGHPAEDLVSEALSGTPAHRCGVAEVAASNFIHEECRAWCEPLLTQLFNDSDQEVRRKAVHCISLLRQVPISDYEGLIDAFCDSGAYQVDSFWILHILEESHYKLPAITLKVCQKFLSRFGDEARDIQTSRYGDSRTMSKLVFRVYQQYMNTDLGSTCLDLIDTMILEGLQDAQDCMADFER